MKRQHVINIMLFIGVLVAIGCSLIFVNKPFEVDAITYIGVIATLIGCAITLLVGYQILNTIEIKRKISDLEEKSHELETAIFETHESKEAMSSTLLQLNPAFGSLSNYIIYVFDLKTLRWQLKYKNHYDIVPSEIKMFKKDAFKDFYVEDIDDSIRILDRGNKSVSEDEAVQKYIDIVKSIDIIIRRDDNYFKIQASYERMMNSFYKKMKELYGVE